MLSMKSSLVLVSILAPAVCLAQADHAALQRTLLVQSNAAYQAVQEHNLAALQATVTPDILEISSAGILGPGGFPAMLQQCKLTSYHLSQASLRVLNATAAILAYNVNQVSGCGKKPDPPVTYSTDVFVYRTGKWLIAAHTETGAE